MDSKLEDLHIFSADFSGTLLCPLSKSFYCTKIINKLANKFVNKDKNVQH